MYKRQIPYRTTFDKDATPVLAANEVVDAIPVSYTHLQSKVSAFPYQAHGYYTYSNLLLPYYSSDATGSEILAMHNESLKWQTTKSTNLALELGFLDPVSYTHLVFSRSWIPV